MLIQTLETCWDAVTSFLRAKQMDLPHLFFVAPYDLPAVYGSLAHPRLANRYIYQILDNIKLINTDEADLADWVVSGVTTFHDETLSFASPWPYIATPGESIVRCCHALTFPQPC